MYERYLFSSTNLKAKATKFIDRAQWQWLADASYEDCIDWLKTTWYKPIVDQEPETAFQQMLLDELSFLSRNLEETYLKLLVWDGWFHALKYKREGLKNPLVIFAEKMQWQFEKEILKTLEQVWFSRTPVAELRIDVLNLNVSFEYESALKSENIRSFWRLRNQLLLLKLILRCKTLNLPCDELNRFEWFKTKDLIARPVEDWPSLVPPQLKDPLLRMIEGKDVDLVIRAELYRFAQRAFKTIVSGPEVLVYYFYHKLWEIEDLMSLLECKKNNVPKQVWQERMLKLNV
ncbi:MAG: hypothetical protein XD58_0271 [Thermotoga sp. 50_1627]|uniref:hypothetical protein n=1 Tax=Pseudothermotoga sp. TaxID=2033661 RepID=UPI00076CED7C|nr:MAG: hypothetical protein XD45_0511 [Thermotoga sp. 50_64]KUK25834.1 MAG: hypothetical protein XD58_0271 [Thermotoga sp. 50_1627]MBC7115519.1 V-type ATPase subunit [Pseudothermotoga sp.]MDK2923985.1 hypothetical protein [Pseudothermotoga sp.]HBT40063.1 hypothetical protein [Pseudothermotoga sp.]